MIDQIVAVVICVVAFSVLIALTIGKAVRVTGHASPQPAPDPFFDTVTDFHNKV